MSMDDVTGRETMQAIEPVAGEALERVLGRYARVRLDPSPAEVRRARAAVMEAAWRSRIQANTAGRRRRRPFAGWSGRRFAVAASVAMLAGVTLGSTLFAASRAGGPLYDARIAFEDLTLPNDPQARLQARLANAQARLAEAFDAEVRGDQTALIAALNAYEVDAATLGTTSGSDVAPALAAVQQHRTLLLSLLQDAPAAAVPGLDQALASSDRAIQQLTAADAGKDGGSSGGGSNGGSNGGGSGGGGNGGGSGSGGGSGHGNGGWGSPSPHGSPSPKHQPLPAPSDTPRPHHTPGPIGNPAPAPTPTQSQHPDHGGQDSLPGPSPSPPPP